MAQPIPDEYRFASFALDPARARLRTGSKDFLVDSRLIRFLTALIEQHGRTVSRAFLRRRLWPGHKNVDEVNLHVLVCQVRKLLGDDAKNPRFIRTYRGHGFRFICPVETVYLSTERQGARTRAASTCERARHAWAVRTPGAIRRSITLYGQAIDHDPTFAPAWSGRADAWIMAGIHCLMPPVEAFLRARSDAKRALHIDPASAEAMVSEAWVKLCFDRDLLAACREFKKALSLKPDYPFAHNGLALLHIARGNPRRAIVAMTDAWGNEASAPFLNALLGDCHYHAREYEKAAQRAELALLTNPDFTVAHACLGRVCIQQKKFEDAIRHFEKARNVSQGSLVMAGFLAHAYGAAGQQSKAQEILEEFRARRNKSEYVPAFFVAVAEIGLGRKIGAIAELKIAIEERSHWVLFLRTEPLLDPLRRDRKFAALLRTL